MVKILERTGEEIKKQEKYRKLVDITKKDLGDLEDLAIVGNLFPDTFSILKDKTGLMTGTYIGLVDIDKNIVTLEVRDLYKKIYKLTEKYEDVTGDSWTFDPRRAR